MDNTTKLNELRGIIELIQDVIDQPTNQDQDIIKLTLHDIDRAIRYLNQLYKEVKDIDNQNYNN